MHFKKIESKDNIQEVLKSAFNVDMEVSGSWGYDKNNSSIINKKNATQTELMLATMRANLEMGMTLSDDKRYGSINLKELHREEISEDITYHKVVYEISAMKESKYKSFIEEYKKNHEKKKFDLAKHFENRKLATIKIESTYFFILK